MAAVDKLDGNMPNPHPHHSSWINQTEQLQRYAQVIAVSGVSDLTAESREEAQENSLLAIAEGIQAVITARNQQAISESEMISLIEAFIYDIEDRVRKRQSIRDYAAAALQPPAAIPLVPYPLARTAELLSAPEIPHSPTSSPEKSSPISPLPPNMPHSLQPRAVVATQQPYLLDAEIDDLIDDMERGSPLEEKGDKELTGLEYPDDLCHSGKEGEGVDEGYYAEDGREEVEEDDVKADAGGSLEGT